MAERLDVALRQPGAVTIIPYVMVGFPDRQASLDTAARLCRCGIAALELGVPFSDPLADGPTIQRAGEVALRNGTTTSDCLAAAAQVARGGVPVVLMIYVNSLLAHGIERFARDAATAGVAGLIVPDLPVDEAAEVFPRLREKGLETIQFVTPTSTDARIRMACEASSGFVYCVTITGTTGARANLPPALPGLLERVRLRCDLPVAAGFGISRPDHVQALRGAADAAVVGSALIDEMDAGRDPAILTARLVAAGAAPSG